jgi:hypothetical protein
MALDAKTSAKLAKFERNSARQKLLNSYAKMKKQPSLPALDLVIPYDVYHAFLTYHGNAAVNEIVKQCRITIESGAKVYFVTNFVNAPREVNHIFQTQADVDAWVAAIAEASKN